MVTITAATQDDFATIQNIAHTTWPDVYGSILSKEQLTYMLDAFYSTETLLDNMVVKNHHFILVHDASSCLGFAAFEHHYLGKPQTRLHKIYLLPAAQGKGAGKALLEAVVAYAKENASTTISLNVNRYNNACSFYEKMGFTTVGQEDIAIGHGYLMEDFKMEKEI